MSAIKSHVHACFYCQVPSASPVIDTVYVESVLWSRHFQTRLLGCNVYCKSAANLFELNNSKTPGRPQEVPQVLSLEVKNCV